MFKYTDNWQVGIFKKFISVTAWPFLVVNCPSFIHFAIFWIQFRTVDRPWCGLQAEKIRKQKSLTVFDLHSLEAVVTAWWHRTTLKCCFVLHHTFYLKINKSFGLFFYYVVLQTVLDDFAEYTTSLPWNKYAVTHFVIVIKVTAWPLWRDLSNLASAKH